MAHPFLDRVQRIVRVSPTGIRIALTMPALLNPLATI